MKLGFTVIAGVMAASSAHAQERSDIPSGNPLGAAATAPEQARAARQAQLQTAARARANVRAMADAFTPAAPAPIDEGRPRMASSTSTFGQTIGSTDTPARLAPSPYGGYYQIRTPWDGR